MRKNILSAIVIFFMTLAFLVVINDITNSKNYQYQSTVEIYEPNVEQPEMVTTDLENEE